MNKYFRNFGIVLLAVFLPTWILAGGNVGASGLRFTENRGQYIGTDGLPRNQEIFFKGQLGGSDIYLTRYGISFVIVSLDVEEQQFHDMEGEAAEKMRMANATQILERLDMNLIGMSPNFSIRRGEAANSVDNFYLGHCPDGILDVKSYSEIVYEGVYPGIDWHFLVKDGQLKTEFHVAPGADPNQIRFAFQGAQSMNIQQDGSFDLMGSTGHIVDDQPTAFQDEVTVPVSFVLNANELQFAVGNYDHNEALVIDPYTRVYATYFGGSGNEWYLGHVTTTDASGNIYLAGHTNSANFPTTPGVFQTANAGGNDGFVAKFNNTGGRLWATYYGGSGSEGGIAFKAGLTIDPSGNVWFATVTSSANFPVTAGCFQATNAGSPDAALVKLTTAGLRLYATYYGGSGNESPSISRWGANSAPAIASDLNGNIFMTGLTQSANLPVTAGCFQPANAGGTDAYLVKWSNAGTRLYATYYGGTGNEESAAVGIAVDASGNAWMTGCTGSTNFPVTAGCFQATNAGSFDQFLVKWNNACVRQYATYYGGSSDEGILCDVDVSASGEVWMGVFVQSTNFPVTPGASQPSSAGGWEFGVVKFNNAGARMYASYYGSGDQEEPWDISVDKINGNVCLTGAAWGASFPTLGSPYQPTSAGSQEGAIVVLNSLGTPIYVTYYGGSGHDEVFCTVFDVFQNLWASGMAANSTFPVTPGAFQTVIGGGTDAFLVKFTPPIVLDESRLDLQVKEVDGQSVSLNWTFSEDQLVESYDLERDLGGRWESIYTVAATNRVAYDFTDEVPMQGMVQYRIRLEMKDGSQAYSEMVRVTTTVTEDRLIAAWPVPAKVGEDIHVNWQMKEAGDVNVEVTTIEGKVVYVRQHHLDAGRKRFDFPTQDWAAGTYLLTIKSANGAASAKISVE
jgi:hypothetical protein